MTFDRTLARLPFVAAAALVTVASFALTAPATAGTAAPVEAAAPAPAAANPDKKICVNARFTGSRMTKKVCKTQAQWDAQQGPASN